MLSRIIHGAVQGRIAVVLLCITLIILGISHLQNAPMDVFPEFAPLKIEVQTEAPGLSTEDVENLVTVALEQAVNGTPGLKTLRSKSVLGLSSVVMLFDEGVDIHKARQFVQERIALASTKLPAVAKSPVILPPLSSLSRVLKIGVTSKTLSQMDISSTVITTVRPKLMSIPGVANVAVWGQRDKQLQVMIDPERMRARKVSLQQVIKASGDTVVVDSGGFVETPNQRLPVTYDVVKPTPETLGQAIVDLRNGIPIRLMDVADVRIGTPSPIGDAIINGVPGILLIVEKHPNANTLAVTQKIEAALNQIKPGLGDIEIDSTIFRPATFVERAISNLKHAFLAGVLLISLIIVTFLNNKRAALISLVAMPLSVLAAIGILTYLNIPLNTMVIAGLVIALGEVVDDAIIDVENILRRLKLNKKNGDRIPRIKVIVDASLEVRSSVIFATVIVVLVFLPVFFLSGIAGAFFKPLALACILAISASLMVALLVTPALSYMLFAGAQLSGSEKPSKVAVWMHERYAPMLKNLLAKPKLSISIIGVSLAVAAAMSCRFGSEFLPEFQETDLLMHFLERPGASVERMHDITIRASNELMAIPGVRNFGSHIGRAEVADEVVGPNFTELWISIDPQVDYKSTVAKVKGVMQKYSGLYTDVQTYLKERSKEVMSGTSASIVVRVFGPDMSQLRRTADEIKMMMADINGIADLKVESQVLVPQIQIRVKSDQAQRYGLTSGEIKRIATTYLKSLKVGEVYEEQQRVDVVVWSKEEQRSDINSIREIPIDTASGLQLRLKDVADVLVTPMPNEIKREAASRRLDIMANVQGRDVGSVAKIVEAKVKALSFPRGYHPEFLGEYVAQREASQRLWVLTAIILLAIALILYADFKTIRHATIIFLTLPFALVGAVIGVSLSGSMLSLGSIVGFVAVIGIAARNGIMLISHYRHLETKEGVPFGENLILQGTKERLIPIIMTASAAALALLPIIIGGPKPGYEVEYPLAVVVVGGLVSSTLLNLLLLPSVYLKYGKSFKAA